MTATEAAQTGIPIQSELGVTFWATAISETAHAVGDDGRSRCGNIPATGWIRPLGIEAADHACRSCVRLVALDGVRWDPEAARRDLEAVRAPIDDWEGAWRLVRREHREAAGVLDEILDEIGESHRQRNPPRHRNAVQLLDRLVRAVVRLREQRVT